MIDVVSGLSLAIELDWLYLRSIARVSLTVSTVAVLISTAIAIPIALAVGLRDFRGKDLLTAIILTGMGFPSVVIGLIVLLMVSRQGPLAPLDLAFTPEAMVLAQVVLATPVIAGVSLAAVVAVDRPVRDAAYAMGGTRIDVALVTIKQARYGIVTGILVGFGRAISEVGSVLIVGGNIVWSDGTSYTRTLTTAIQLEARQGQYEVAIVIGAVLLSIFLLVNLLVLRLGRSAEGYH